MSDNLQSNTPADQPIPINSVEYWNKEFAAAKKWMQKFHTEARKVEKAYMGDKETQSSEDVSKFNLFWSNTQTMLSAAYNRIPKVEVDRTHLDSADDVARVAALILERIFQFEDNNVEDSPHYTYQECIQDRLVAGMGVAWPRYSFTELQTAIPNPVNPAQPFPVNVITDEICPLDYVRWEDFLVSPCRRWGDKRWVARRVPMYREALVKRFGEEKAAAIPLNYKGAIKSPDADDPFRYTADSCAEVWEIWELTTKSVYWYVPGYATLCDSKQDPLQLRNFWPCSRPLLATTSTKSLIPKPDYCFVKSQYDELNLVAARCGLLTEAIKVVGVYDSSSDALKKLLNEGNHNDMVPVDNWAMFAERGGIKGAVDWFPLEMVIETLMQLVQRKRELSQEVYEIMGISDIMRGMATTTETATTQRLKAQFGSSRGSKPSEEIARFITENSRLRAEIICRHWQPQTILQRSQIEQTPDNQFAQQAVMFLKRDPTLLTRITVSADTFVAPDWDMEKQQRIDFLQAISQFIGMVEPLVQAHPGIGTFMVEILQWAASGFKGAKQIEGVMDRMLESMKKEAAAPKPPKPWTPEEMSKAANAMKTMADARGSTVDSLKVLAELGLPPQVLAMIPPQGQLPPQPGVGGPPPGPGMGPQAPGPVPPGRGVPRMQAPAPRGRL